MRRPARWRVIAGYAARFMLTLAALVAAGTAAAVAFAWLGQVLAR